MFNLFVILTVICASEAVPGKQFVQQPDRLRFISTAGFAARDFMNDVLVPAAFQTVRCEMIFER